MMRVVKPFFGLSQLYLELLHKLIYIADSYTKVDVYDIFGEPL